MPSLVIGKSKIPQAFRKTLGFNKKNREFIKPPPVKWLNSLKSLMTLEIFSNWLEDINKKFSREMRKVLLFIDNCTTHRDLELSNVNIFLYPANRLSN